jgi:aquaporin Z
VKHTLKPLLAEALGTFLLIAIGAGAIVVNDSTHGAITHFGVCLTFGVVVVVMIVLLGRYSGCHINPSVTIALWVRGILEKEKVIPYLLSQSIGAVFAGLLLHALAPYHPNLGGTNLSVPLWLGIAIETVISGLLMSVVIFVVDMKFPVIRAAVAIGATVFLLAFIAGPYTGASMNPARSLGPVIGSGNTGDLWVYFLAPTIGMLLSALIIPRKSTK